MADKKLQSYRLSASTISKLSTLAKLDGISRTRALIRLINTAYRERAEEIREFRKSLKIDENQ
jgi:hypothetical protein